MIATSNISCVVAILLYPLDDKNSKAKERRAICFSSDEEAFDSAVAAGAFIVRVPREGPHKKD